MHRFVRVRKCLAWLGLEQMHRFVRVRKCHRFVISNRGTLSEFIISKRNSSADSSALRLAASEWNFFCMISAIIQSSE